ncbi:MAG: hypothetical protein HC860_18735 [Alkalinema sp. RU_4_3]|nr:hypothetical protein [Alkalinema sp. RU_4_3]NJR70436.1 hypothetical protein [Synechococcales cyanobacterium CRU_2_2]
MKTFLNIGRFALSAFVGYLMILNAQPWLSFARYTAPMLQHIPLVDVLIKIPFLGGWVQFIAQNIVSIAGLLAWAVIQFLEILPMAYDKEKTYNNLIQQWQGKQFDSEKEKNAALKKLKEAYNALATEDISALETYRNWAYVAEFIACFVLYCPYEGGIAGLIADSPAWDSDSILWNQVLMIPLSMFGFEVLVKVLIRLWRLNRKAGLTIA